MSVIDVADDICKYVNVNVFKHSLLWKRSNFRNDISIIYTK